MPASIYKFLNIMSKDVERFSSDELLALYVAATMRRDDFTRFGTPVFEGERPALSQALEKLRRLTSTAENSGEVQCSEVEKPSDGEHRVLPLLV